MSKKLAPQSRPVNSVSLNRLKELDVKTLQAGINDSSLEAELEALADAVNLNRYSEHSLSKLKPTKERKRKLARIAMEAAREATAKRLARAKAAGSNLVLRAVWDSEKGRKVLELISE